jgi:hypothetical protein
MLARPVEAVTRRLNAGWRTITAAGTRRP